MNRRRIFLMNDTGFRYLSLVSAWKCFVVSQKTCSVSDILPEKMYDRLELELDDFGYEGNMDHGLE